jgi:hypothetical protein
MYQRRATGTGAEQQGDMPAGVYTPHSSKKRGAGGRTRALFLLLITLVALTIFYPRLLTLFGGASPPANTAGTPADTVGPVLVSYSYFEKDPVQVSALLLLQGARQCRQLPPPALKASAAAQTTSSCLVVFCSERISTSSLRLAWA